MKRSDRAVPRALCELVSTLVGHGKPAPPRKLAERTAGNAIWNLLPLGWSTCINIVALPVIIDRLGFKDYGIYGVFAIFLAPLTLANLGFGEATIKYVAQYAAAGDLEAAAKFIRTTLFMNLLVGVAGALVMALAGPPLAVALAGIPAARLPLLNQCFRFVAVGWVANQVGGVFMGVPAAFQNFKAVSLLRIATSAVSTGLGLAAVLAGTGLRGYTMATAGAAVISAGAWYWTSRALFGRVSLAPKLSKEAWKSCFRFGGWQTLGQVGGLLAGQSDQIIITGLFQDTRLLGYFNSAKVIQERIYGLVFKMSEVLFPLFSQLSGESVAQKADKLMRSSWLLTTLAVAALAPLIPLATPLLSIYINPEAGAHVAVLLRVLALGGILGCASNASYYFLLGNGRTEWTAALSVATGVANVLGGLVLLPLYGFKAAAVPALVAMLVQQYLLSCRMLPAVFEGRLPVWRIWASLYSPILASAPVILLCWAAGPARWIHGFPALIAAYIVLSGLCLAGIVAANRLFKAGREHEADLRLLFRWGEGLMASRGFPKVRER